MSAPNKTVRRLNEELKAVEKNVVDVKKNMSALAERVLAAKRQMERNIGGKEFSRRRVNSSKQGGSRRGRKGRRGTKRRGSTRRK
jgi:hypothetical protein